MDQGDADLDHAIADALTDEKAETEMLRALVRHMQTCVKRGGPSNYEDFLPEELAEVHTRAVSEHHDR